MHNSSVVSIVSTKSEQSVGANFESVHRRGASLKPCHRPPWTVATVAFQSDVGDEKSNYIETLAHFGAASVDSGISLTHVEQTRWKPASESWSRVSQK